MDSRDTLEYNAGQLVGAILGLYSLTIPVAALYLNWQYANTHGFLAWLCFGEVVATLKAIVWPLWLFWS